MALLITLSYPPAAYLYRSRVPKVFIDDVPQPVTGWGEHRFEVSPGPHRLHVYVPYSVPRRAGKVDLEVTVPEAGDLPIEYIAPSITMARGSMGTPGAQVSTGASVVTRANVFAFLIGTAALAFVLVTFIAR